MPYSPRYLMEQAARGRLHPQGRPEDHLFQALEHANPMDLERAIHMGAQPMGARDGQGKSAIEVLLSSNNRHRARPEQVLACARTLLRYNALAQTNRRTNPLMLAAAWAGCPSIAASWWQLWSPASCRTLADQWHCPDAEGQTPVDHWKAQATPELTSLLERAFPSPQPSIGRPPAGPGRR